MAGAALLVGALGLVRLVFYAVLALLLQRHGDATLADGLVDLQQGHGRFVPDVLVANAVAQAVGLGGLAWVAARLGLPRIGSGVALPRGGSVGFGAAAVIGLVGLLPLLQWMAAFVGRQLPPPLRSADAESDALLGALLSGAGEGALALALVCLALVPAVFEERFFRGVLLPVWGRTAPWTGVVASAVVFAGYHGRVAQFVPLLLIGLFLGAVAVRSGRLWPCVAAHGVYNGLLVTVAMTGGRGGAVPEPGALVVGCGLAVAAGALAWLFARPAAPAPVLSSASPSPPTHV